MRRAWQRVGCTLVVLGAVWCVAFGHADDAATKKAPLKKSKKFNANEGDVRLVGSNNTFEGKFC